MWSEFITTNTRKFISYIFKSNNEKNAILDPFSSCGSFSNFKFQTGRH